MPFQFARKLLKIMFISFIALVIGTGLYAIVLVNEAGKVIDSRLDMVASAVSQDGCLSEDSITGVMDNLDLADTFYMTFNTVNTSDTSYPLKYAVSELPQAVTVEAIDSSTQAPAGDNLFGYANAVQRYAGIYVKVDGEVKFQTIIGLTIQWDVSRDTTVCGSRYYKNLDSGVV